MTNQIQISAVSDTGYVRNNNEDNLYVDGRYMQQGKQGNFQLSKIIETKSFVYAVCDGMGGEKSGERASFEAVNRLNCAAATSAFLSMTLQEKIQDINKYIEETNSAINSMSAISFDLKGMGTTFVCLVAADDQAAAMHVGDSRAYLLREGIFTQLTRDHSESERLIRLGIITREQARGHKSRFMLNRHLGMPPEEGLLEADTSNIIKLQKYDTFLLCSDGLTDMVEDEIIKDILSDRTDSKTAAQMLVDEALKNGGKDNITAVVIKFLNIESSVILPTSRKEEYRNSQRQKILLACAVVFLAALVVTVALLSGNLSN